MTDKALFLKNDLFVTYVLVPVVIVFGILAVTCGPKERAALSSVACLNAVLVLVLGRTQIKITMRELSVRLGFLSIRLLGVDLADIKSVDSFELEWRGINLPVYKLANPDRQRKGMHKLPAVLVRTSTNSYAIVPRSQATRIELQSELMKVVNGRRDSA